MPKPKIYPETILLRLTRETRRAIDEYRKDAKIKQAQAIRELLNRGLTEHDYWPYKQLGERGLKDS